MFVAVEFIIAVVLLRFVWRWFKLWNFWRERGVKSYGYPPPIGALLPAWSGRLTFAQLGQKIFEKNPGSKMIGSWILSEPVLFVKDHHCVHQILSEDFSTWPDRGFKDDPSLDPLSQHLINIRGNKWKTVRSWLASEFGLMAMRNRHEMLILEAEKFVSSLSSDQNIKVDIVQMSKKSVLTLLTQIALGTPSSSSEVDNLVNDAFSANLWTTLRTLVRIACPFLLSYIGCKRFNLKHETSFIKIVDQRFQTADAQSKQDMLQILINSYKQYQLSEPNNNEITYEVVASNAFAVLAAGYDTTASSLAWMFYELARNPQVQERLHDEVHTVLSANGALTQVALKQMAFLDNIISEVLRLYPSVSLTSRVCRKETYLDGVKIEPGTRVMIPIYAMQRDKNYFPSPDSFVPERFSQPSLNKTAYLPFGKGPRICLGWRLAELMLKIFAVSLVKDFRLSLSSEMTLPVGYTPYSIFLAPSQPILLQITPRN